MYIFRSGAFRVALAFAVSVSITSYSVFAYVYLRVFEADVIQIRIVLQDEAEKAAGLPSDLIRQQFDLRLTHDLRRLDFVGIYDPNGVLIYGNAPRPVPVPVDGISHVHGSPAVMSEDRGPSIFVARRRADGNIVLLGRSLIGVYRLGDTMRSAFITTIVPTAILALLVGAVVSLRASWRLKAIRLAINRVMRGEVETRLPTQSGSDDINEVVAAVNLMLDELLRLLGQIKSVGDNIAHDLKAPLASMRARLERGIAAEAPDELRKAAAIAIGDLDRAMDTVMALMRISELESGDRRRKFEPMDIASLCRDVHELFEPLAHEKRITMTLDAPAACTVLGDRALLCEALANLVDNAIKYTPSGGMIDLKCSDNPGMVLVSDTGIGVANWERDKIFTRFYRSSRVCGIPGVGLGLSMAATIIELHGFKLRVRDNAPGSIFEIALR